MKRTIVMCMLVCSLILSSCGTKDTGNNNSESNAPAQTEEQKTEEKAIEEKSLETFEGKYLVNADYVKENLDNPNVIFVDARGEDAAKEGKVPNAVVMTWQDLANVKDKNPGDEGWGHVLSVEELSKILGDFGLDPTKEIVLYATGQAGWGDDGRILWELKAAGYDNLKMVNGGIDKIKEAGVELSKEETTPVKADVKIDQIDRTNIIDTEELAKDIGKYKIVDTREKDEYEGAVKFGEKQGGHLPNAMNIPYSELYQENGLLKSNAEIEKIFEEAGLKKEDEIVAYCTGGIRSAFFQLIAEMMGYNNVKNYEGSYYNWAASQDVEK